MGLSSRTIPLGARTIFCKQDGASFDIPDTRTRSFTAVGTEMVFAAAFALLNGKGA